MASEPSLLMLNPRHPSYLSMLDEATIGKICDYLSLYELLVIADMDMNYQRLIGERIIAKSSLDISLISRHFDVRRAFRLFGEFATKLKVHESDIQYKDEQYTLIEEIFRLITKRCVTGRLKSVSIVMNGDKKEKRSIKKIPDVFKEVESLSIKPDGGKLEFVDKFMLKMISKCKNLRSLSVEIKIPENASFLSLPKLNDIQSLTLRNCRISWIMWKSFINAGVRPLKSLVLDNCEFYSPTKTTELNFYGEIGAAFPNIVKFVYARGWSPTIIDKSFIIDIIRWQKLEELGIDFKYQHNDLFSVLNVRNTVKRLSLVSYNNFQPSPYIKMLTNLRSIQLDFGRKNEIPFIIEFIKLPHLTEWSFSNYVDESVIYAIISGCSKLQTLKLNHVSFNHSGNFLTSISNLRQKMFPNSSPVHIYGPYRTVMPATSKIILHVVNPSFHF